MSWAAAEVAGGQWGDRRLRRRLEQLLERLSEKPTQSILAACRSWAEVQAAYRFLSNSRVDAVDILDGHSRATLKRMAQEPVVLIPQDTTFLETSRTRPGRHWGRYGVRSKRSICFIRV